MKNLELLGDDVKTPEEFAEKLNQKFAEFSDLKNAVIKQGESITKMKTLAGHWSKAPFKDQMVKALEENKVSSIKRGESMNFEVKTITAASMIAGDNEVGTPLREAEIDKAPRNIPFVQDLIQWGTTNGNTVDWLEQTTKTDASAMRDEDDEILAGALEYTEVSTKVKNLAQLIKVTEESLSDYNFLASEISTELTNDLNLLLSTQLLTGDGLTVNLLGFTELATAFDAGDFAAKVTSANYLDVLRVAINQIILAGKGRFSPNYIIVNPSDLTKIQFIKNSLGDYILPSWVTESGLRIAGVKIITNTAMTPGDYLVGDFTKAKGYSKGGLQIKIGYEGTDFKYNRVTVRGTLRVAFRVKNQDKPAFVIGAFDTDLQAIEVVGT